MTQPMLLCTLQICDPLPDNTAIQRWDDVRQTWVWCNGAEVLSLVLMADSMPFKWEGADKQ
jgi:hypothetical protein